MKKNLIYGIVLLVTLFFGSCGSKVNKAALDKKIENMDPDNVSFTNDEYEFMTDYLLKHMDDDSSKTEEVTDEDAQQFVYFAFLSEAEDNGKLQGKTKEKFEKCKKKLNSIVEAAQKEAMKSLDQAVKAADEVNDEDFSYEATEGDPPIGY